MNYSKIVLTKTTIAIFLAVVLVTGTIAALSSFSSSFITNAQATSDREKNHNDDDDRKSYKKERDRDRDRDDKSRDHDNDDDRKSYKKDKDYEVIIDNRIDNKYGKPYENDNKYYKSQYPSSSSYKSDYYKPKYSSYDKENNHNNNIYKSTKDSSGSNSVDIKKINCNNINVNINGGQGAINGNDGNGNDGNRNNSSSDDGNKTNHGLEKFNKKEEFTFVCVNNNDNRQITPTLPPTPPPINNNAYVVWTDNSTGNNEIFFAVSNNNGQTFSTPKNISNNTGDSIEPKILSEGDNVYVVWWDNTPGNFEIFFARSTNGGQTFSTPDNISENAGRSSLPQISSEGDNVYIVWEDNTPGNNDVFFTVSNNNGDTFNTPINLSNNPRESLAPQISSEGDNVYVVWYDNTPLPGNFEIFFTVSNNNGDTFSTPADNLSNNQGLSLGPQISSEGDNVYVVWSDNTPGNGDIFFARSTDNGQTFSTPDNISENAGNSNAPQISYEGDNVYVVWQDDTGGNGEILFTVSNNNGDTFITPAENISNSAGFSQIPQISSEGDNVYVVWYDIDNSEIFFTVSNNNGQTFSTPENISNTSGSRSHIPQISSEGDNVYVVWQDETPGNFEIFFARSTNGGQTFSEPPDNLSKNTGDSLNPQISSSTS